MPLMMLLMTHRPHLHHPWRLDRCALISHPETRVASERHRHARAGDEGSIRVGEGSNVQDNCAVHTSRTTLGGHGGGTTIGDNVTVGHSVVLDCVIIEDEALIGMGATLLPGVKAGPRTGFSHSV